MDNIDLSTPLKESFEGLRKYIDHLVIYNKLVFTKKIGEVSSYLTLFIALGFLSTLSLIFLSFGFVWWFSDGKVEEMYIGFLIVASVYALIGIMIYIFREGLVFKPIRKALGNVIFADIDSSKKNEVFESSEMLDAKINNSKESLKLKEKELTDLIDGLEDTYTFRNIGKHFLQNIYKSLVTTTNITKLAFTLVQNIQKKKRKRKLEDKNAKTKLED